MGAFDWVDTPTFRFGFALAVVVLLLAAVILLSFITGEVGKSGFSGAHGNHGGYDLRVGADAGDQPGYSLQKPYGAGVGVNSLTCGTGTAAQRNTAMNKISGEALEAQLLGAMDDYMTADTIALDKAIGSTYQAGTSSAAN
jgi:hypothetical protein